MYFLFFYVFLCSIFYVLNGLIYITILELEKESSKATNSLKFAKLLLHPINTQYSNGLNKKHVWNCNNRPFPCIFGHVTGPKRVSARAQRCEPFHVRNILKQYLSTIQIAIHFHKIYVQHPMLIWNNWLREIVSITH